jgi:transposase
MKSVIGISTLSAMTFLTELADIDRFKNLDKLASCIGLVPDVRGSGEKETNSGITSRCNPHLRGVLVEAAWITVRKDPAMMMAYNQMLRNVSKKVAIIKIARKLLNRIRYVLKNKQEYVPAVVQ